MSLRIVSTRDTHRVPQALVEAIHTAKQQSDQVVVLSPAFDWALDISKALADKQIGMGVQSATLGVWLDDIHRLYGDGTQLVDGVTRYLSMRDVIVREFSDLVCTPGTVRLCARIAQNYAWAVAEGKAVDAAALDSSEQCIIAVIESYLNKLSERNMAEKCLKSLETISAWLQMDVKRYSFVIYGVQQMPLWQQKLIALLAQKHDVSFWMSERPTPAFDLTRYTLASVMSCAEKAGVDVVRDRIEQAEEGSATEIDELVDRLFTARAQTSGALESTGAIELLYPAGPLASFGLVSQKIGELKKQGMHNIAVCARDTYTVYEGLYGRMLKSGIQAQGTISVSVKNTPAYKTVMGCLETLANLCDAPDTKQAGEVKHGEVELGDMNWWPPRKLIDFLESDFSGMEPSEVWALDAAWRGNRLLSAKSVLAQLQKETKTSKAVAAFVRDVCQGRIAHAVSSLADDYRCQVEDNELESLDSLIALKVLDAISVAASTLSAYGIGLSGTKTKALDQRTLTELVGLMRELLSKKKAMVSVAHNLEDADTTVSVILPAKLAQMGYASFDAVIMMDLTTTQDPIQSSDNAYAALAQKLEGRNLPTSMMMRRQEFFGDIQTAARKLIFERTKFDSNAKETFPSVMLSEALGVYGCAGAKDNQIPLPISSRGEDLLTQNVRLDNDIPLPDYLDNPLGIDLIDDDHKECLLLPVPGAASSETSKPTLSASQLESYIECPCKWFSLRRLNLNDSDAGFSPLEIGSFVHRVMELMHLRLLEEAVASAGMTVEDVQKDPTIRLPGSRIMSENLAHAKELMEQAFDEHLEHQYKKGTRKNAQALIAHSEVEAFRIRRLKNQLASALESEVDKFLRFEPRFFELRFGGRSGIPVEYAGVNFTGSIDRVDVDDQGNALIIDYKHKGILPQGEYALMFEKDYFELDDFMPRHVQSLIYAQVLRRTMPDLNPVGAIYMSTMPPHGISGAVCRPFVERIWGAESSKAIQNCSLPIEEDATFSDLLNATEETILNQIIDMRNGEINARPIDEKACKWCPVALCEKRLK